MTAIQWAKWQRIPYSIERHGEIRIHCPKCGEQRMFVHGTKEWFACFRFGADRCALSGETYKELEKLLKEKNAS